MGKFISRRDHSTLNFTQKTDMAPIFMTIAAGSVALNIVSEGRLLMVLSFEIKKWLLLTNIPNSRLEWKTILYFWPNSDKNWSIPYLEPKTAEKPYHLTSYLPLSPCKAVHTSKKRIDLNNLHSIILMRVTEKVRRKISTTILNHLRKLNLSKMPKVIFTIVLYFH